MLRFLLVCAVCIAAAACARPGGLKGGHTGTEIRSTLVEMSNAISDENVTSFIQTDSYERDWRAKVTMWQQRLNSFQANLPASETQVGTALTALLETLKDVQSGSTLREHVTVETGRMQQQITALEQALAATAFVGSRGSVTVAVALTGTRGPSFAFRRT